MLDSNFPLSLDFVPFETFVFRADSCFCLGAIAEILRDGGGAEIRRPIVEAVAVYVVAEHMFRNIDNLAVHPYFLSQAAWSAALPASGV